MAPVTGPLPSATARGKALRREISALGVTASCDAADLWAASRDCPAAALLWTKARAVPHPPDVVVWPEDVEQVSAVVRLAADRNRRRLAGDAQRGNALGALRLHRRHGPLRRSGGWSGRGSPHPGRSERRARPRPAPARQRRNARHLHLRPAADLAAAAT